MKPISNLHLQRAESYLALVLSRNEFHTITGVLRNEYCLIAGKGKEGVILHLTYAKTLAEAKTKKTSVSPTLKYLNLPTHHISVYQGSGAMKLFVPSALQNLLTIPSDSDYLIEVILK